jgi:hypothetical protein
MSKIMSIIFLLSVISINAYSIEAGRCRLTGKYKASGTVIAPWKSEKRKFNDISLDRCLEAAKTLLAFEIFKSYDDCSVLGPCYKSEIKITIRKVKYKFYSKEYKLRGIIKKR